MHPPAAMITGRLSRTAGESFVRCVHLNSYWPRLFEDYRWNRPVVDRNACCSSKSRIQLALHGTGNPALPDHDCCNSQTRPQPARKVKNLTDLIVEPALATRTAGNVNSPVKFPRREISQTVSASGLVFSLNGWAKLYRHSTCLQH